MVWWRGRAWFATAVLSVAALHEAANTRYVCALHEFMAGRYEPALLRQCRAFDGAIAGSSRNIKRCGETKGPTGGERLSERGSGMCVQLNF